MRRHITRALHAAAAAGVAFLTLGFAGAGAPATAAAPSLSPPQYNTGQAGYTSSGRWFRFVSTTVTIPPLGPASQDYGGQILIVLHTTAVPDTARAVILVRPGGGAGTLEWGNAQQVTPFAISPKVGDQVAVSIYCDRHGHDSFTATDLTQHITKTAQQTVGNVVYDQASLWDNLAATVTPPATDIRQWKIADTYLTTYTGTHGTVTGPWQASQVIETTDGTAKGAVVLSPSGLWNGGQNFGIWLRHR
jgi:hypothetical protein